MVILPYDFIICGGTFIIFILPIFFYILLLILLASPPSRKTMLDGLNTGKIYFFWFLVCNFIRCYDTSCIISLENPPQKAHNLFVIVIWKFPWLKLRHVQEKQHLFYYIQKFNYIPSKWTVEFELPNVYTVSWVFPHPISIFTTS